MAIIYKVTLTYRNALENGTYGGTHFHFTKTAVTYFANEGEAVAFRILGGYGLPENLRPSGAGLLGTPVMREVEVIETKSVRMPEWYADGEDVSRRCWIVTPKHSTLVSDNDVRAIPASPELLRFLEQSHGDVHIIGSNGVAMLNGKFHT